MADHIGRLNVLDMFEDMFNKVTPEFNKEFKTIQNCHNVQSVPIKIII